VHLYNTACNTHTHTHIYIYTLQLHPGRVQHSGTQSCSRRRRHRLFYIYKYKRGEGVILIVSYWCIYIRGRAGFEVNSAAVVCSGTGKGAEIGCKSTCDELCVYILRCCLHTARCGRRTGGKGSYNGTRTKVHRRRTALS
jgi:hypothetical protein